MTDTIFCTIAVSAFVVGLLIGFLLGTVSLIKRWLED